MCLSLLSSMEYAIYVWSILAASLLALLLYCKILRQRRSEDDDQTPSLFENITFMKSESWTNLGPRRRTNSQLKKRRSQEFSIENYKYSQQHQNVADLLATLGIKNEKSLQQIITSFRPISVGQGVKLSSLINLSEHIVVVQTGEVTLAFTDGKDTNFQISRVVKNGEVIYSKLAVIQYLLNYPGHPEDVPIIETNKATTFLILPFKVLKSLTNEDAIVCSISQFIAEIQKIVIDAFHGELSLPVQTMFKYEKSLTETTDVAKFLSEMLECSEEENFIRSRLVKFAINENEMVTINGFTHDIGLVLITKGSVQVLWTDQSNSCPKYFVKNSWYGFVSLLSSPTGTPFPPSYASEDSTEGYIFTRSAFQELCEKSKTPAKRVAKRILKSMTSFIMKTFYCFNWKTIKSGTKLINKGDAANGAYAVIRGRLRKQGFNSQDDYFLFGVFDCLLDRQHQHTVIAARSSELCFIPAEVLKAIRDRFATVQNKLVKVLGEHLLESWKSKKGQGSSLLDNFSKKKRSLKVRGVAVFASFPDVPLSKFTSDLVVGISLLDVQAKKISSRRVQDQFLQPLDELDPLSNPHLLAWLRDQERSSEVLIYQCDQTMTPWTKWCLSEADVVLDLCLASKGPFLNPFENEVFTFAGLHCDIHLILLHSVNTALPRGTADWLYRRKAFVSAHYHMKTSTSQAIDLHSDVARVGRHILGLDVGLVLGGGGARGAAHVGMIKAIQNVGIPIDRVGGVSIGAFIGGLWATHRDYAKMKILAEEWMLVIKHDYFGHICNVTYPLNSPFTGDFFNSTLKKTLGESIMIEDLWLPYFCCSTDISGLKSRVHTTGWLWRYCRASMSYSWLLPPICDPRDGHLLIDGCYTDNVPGKAMKQTGVKYILALDVAAVDDRDLTNYGDYLSGWWPFLSKMNPFAGKKLKIPDMEEIQLRIAFCSHYRNLEELQRDAHYEYLCPNLGRFTSSDVSRFLLFRQFLLICLLFFCSSINSDRSST